MADTDVTNADVLEAATFLQTFLQEKIPDGDFTPGTPTYDFAIQSVAYIFAYLRKKATVIRNRQSLLTLVQLPEEESVTDAADAVLANVFRTRNGGTRAVGQVIVHFSQRTDVIVPQNARFFRTPSLVYYPDTTQDIFLPATQLTANRGSDGRIVDYSMTVSVIAARVGPEYNQAPGRFVGFDQFSPYATFVEHTVAFDTGFGTQSTVDFIQESATAMSLRALINARSNDATLNETFPEIQKIITVGYGEPEMVRDVVSEVASGVRLHVGGHVDVFVRTSLSEVTDEGVIGDLYPRPDELNVVLRDTTGLRNYLTGVGLTSGQAVVPGDVLVLGAGIPGTPFSYVIRQVGADYVEISERTPFSTATDETTTPPALTFTIGNNYPLFDNKQSTTTSAGVLTSRRISASNQLMLSGRPAYKIKKVEVFSAPASLDPYKDPITGELVFTVQSSVDLVTVPAAGDSLSFRVRVQNPGEAQSARAVTMVEVGWPGVNLDTLTARVTYDTIASFEQIDTFVRSSQNRISAANILPRAFHPIYLSFNIPYALSIVPDAFTQVTVPSFDEDGMSRAIAAFINGYRGVNVLDQSLIATQVRLVSDSVAAVYPFVLQYDLLAPDGRIYRFETTDRVTLQPSETNGATLLNPTDFGLPAVNYEAALQAQLVAAGISDRVVRYFALDSDIVFEQRT